MIIKEQLHCSICNQTIVFGDTCSDTCKLGFTELQDFGTKILKHKQSEDQRVFFHDHSFGELADMFTVCLLRRLHQKSIRGQQDTDKVLARLEHSIISKFNKNYNKFAAKGIVTALNELYKANANLWRLRNRFRDSRLTEDERGAAATEYLTELDARDKAKGQLDVLLDGKTSIFLERIYG